MTDETRGCGPLLVEDAAAPSPAGRSQRSLVAGLTRALAGLDVPAHAPCDVVAVPADLAAGAGLVPHRLAAAEGIALMRLPARAAGVSGPGLTGAASRLLAEARLQVLLDLLDQAVAHLRGRRSGGTRIIDRQLVIGTVADVLAEAELVDVALRTADAGTPLWPCHVRLSELGWEVAVLFGASGYLADSPARALVVSDLVANTWIRLGKDD